MSIRPGAVILHAAGAAVMSYGYISLENLAMSTWTWIHKQKGGSFQYLTIQGLSVAWLTMIASLILDIFPSLTSVRTIKRALFMIALPLAIVISSIYWSLMLLFPALLLNGAPSSKPSSSLEDQTNILYIPLSVDLALHAAPAVTLLFDFLLLERKYTRHEVRYAPLVVAASALWYGLWVEYCASYNKTFPYPFLTHSPLEIRVILYAGVAALALAAFRIINGLHPRE